MAEDERLVTALLLKFSDRQCGWVSVRRTQAPLPVTEFVRAFEAFVVETESFVPRRLRRNFGWLRKTVVRCVDAWNSERRQKGNAREGEVTVEVAGDHLRNVVFVRHRIPQGVQQQRRVSERERRPSPRVSTAAARGIVKPQRLQRRPRRQIRYPPSTLDEEQQKESLPMKGEIVVRSEFAGAILGVKGSTIQNIRMQSGGDVHISETRDGQTRMIEVHGDHHEVLEAHRQVNQTLHREYPDAFQKGVMIPMKTTIELKMSIELATYLTGINRTMLAEIQASTGVAATLHDVEGDESWKLVRLSGSFDKILEAYQAVRAVLDTYEAWLAANQKLEMASVEEPVERRVAFSAPVTQAQTATGELLQVSTAWVMQPDGICKEMQVYLPSPSHVVAPPSLPPGDMHLSEMVAPPPTQDPTGGVSYVSATPTVPRATTTRVVHPHNLYVDERATLRPMRVIGGADGQQPIPQRETQAPQMYAPLTQTVIQRPLQMDQGQVFLLPSTANAATAAVPVPAAAATATATNVYYPAALGTHTTAPMTIQHPKGMRPY